MLMKYPRTGTTPTTPAPTPPTPVPLTNAVNQHEDSISYPFESLYFNIGDRCHPLACLPNGIFWGVFMWLLRLRLYYKWSLGSQGLLEYNEGLPSSLVRSGVRHPYPLETPLLPLYSSQSHRHQYNHPDEVFLEIATLDSLPNTIRQWLQSVPDSTANFLISELYELRLQNTAAAHDDQGPDAKFLVVFYHIANGGNANNGDGSNRNNNNAISLPPPPSANGPNRVRVFLISSQEVPALDALDFYI